MSAGALTCPNCGGLADRDFVRCTFCQAQLQTVACGRCFAPAFLGTKHCAHCGDRLFEGLTQIDPGGPRPECPRCKQALGAVLLKGTILDECDRCGGMWVKQAVFEAMCEQRELGATIRALSVPQLWGAQGAPPDTVAYVPCPTCRKLMNRSNFARISGVLVDTCKPHGTWFDRDELRRIIEFIAAGGLDHARARERAQLDEARRQLEAERRVRTSAPHEPSRWGAEPVEEGDLLATIGAAIWWLLR